MGCALSHFFFFSMPTFVALLFVVFIVFKRIVG